MRSENRLIVKTAVISAVICGACGGLVATCLTRGTVNDITESRDVTTIIDVPGGVSSSAQETTASSDSTGGPAPTAVSTTTITSAEMPAPASSEVLTSSPPVQSAPPAQRIPTPDVVIPNVPGVSPNAVDTAVPPVTGHAGHANYDPNSPENQSREQDAMSYPMPPVPNADMGAGSFGTEGFMQDVREAGAGPFTTEWNSP